MVSATLEVVDLGPPPPLSSEVDRAVDDVWHRCIRERPTLHDGEVFSVASVAATRVTGWFVPYRRFVAQRADASLAEHLAVAPLAVTGRTVIADGRLVVAKRSRRVTQDPGAWELAPAGGVDRSARRGDGRIDLGAALRGELREELGVPDRDVLSVSPVALVVDLADGVHDVVADVLLGIDADALLERFEHRQSDEYDELRLVAVEDAADAFGSERRAAGFDVMVSLPVVP